MRPVLLPLLALLVACDEAGDAPLSRELSLVQDLSLISQGQPMDDALADDLAARLANGHETVQDVVDRLLSSSLVGTRVARVVLLGGGQGVKDRAPVSNNFVLTHFEGPAGQRIYTLRDRCAASEAVEVSPWWDPGHPVLVCPDAARPDVRGDAEGRTCGASTLSPRQVDLCGCGPRLMYCSRDARHHEEVRDSVQAEVNDTVAYIVNEDIPLDELFMMNETVRDRNAEMIYRRARIAAGEPESLADISEFTGKARLAPRVDQVAGQHAGILTAPALIYGSDALRGVMRDYYEMLWCTGQASSRVTTAAVLGLDVVDLREGAGWKQLAGMDICTECHARLDYGMQFFNGYPSTTQGIDFRPAAAYMDEGPLYGRNIHDPRGTDDLSPQGFARLIVEQPEFGECMARKVTDYVFSGAAHPDDYDAVHDAFVETRSFKPMLSAAMVRMGERALQGATETADTSPATAPTSPSPAPATSTPGADAVVLSPWLRDAVDDQCAHCHDGEDAEDLSGGSLPRETLERMLEQVAMGEMPRTPQGLEPDERRAFVDAITGQLWTDPSDLAIARAFFEHRMEPYPVHDLRPALAAVAARAGTDDRPYLRSTEASSAKPQQLFSPTFAVSTAVVALEACREAKVDEAGLADCVARATAPERLVVGGGGAAR